MTDIRLTVQGLAVDYPTARVVDNVSFTLGNERLALVGESGSGKSMTARALMGLVRKPGVVSAERLEVLGRDGADPQRSRLARTARQRYRHGAAGSALCAESGAVHSDAAGRGVNPASASEPPRARRGGQRRHRRRRSGSAGPQPLSRRTLRRDGTAGDDRPRAAQ